MEQVALIAEPFRFAATHDAALAAKRVIYLEDLVPAGYLPLALPARIRRVVLVNEMAGDYPTECAGNITVGVDPGRRYAAAAGFPAVETCLPQLLKLAGSIEFYPGRPKIVRHDHDPAIVYRAGDGIVVAPEVWGTFACEPFIFLAFNVEADGDLPLDPRTVFAQPLYGSSPDAPSYVYRSATPAIQIGGTEVRVHIGARQHGASLADAAIGVQYGSGPNMAAEPVPLTFGGAASLSLAAFKGAWSDWVPLATTVGQSLLVDLRVNGPWGFKDGAPADSWYSGVNSHASAPMLGNPTLQPNRTHCVDAIQVR